MFWLEILIDLEDGSGFCGWVEVAGGVDVGTESIVGVEGVGDVINLAIPEGAVERARGGF